MAKFASKISKKLPGVKLSNLVENAYVLYKAIDTKERPNYSLIEFKECLKNICQGKKVSTTIEKLLVEALQNLWVLGKFLDYTTEELNKIKDSVDEFGLTYEKIYEKLKETNSLQIVKLPAKAPVEPPSTKIIEMNQEIVDELLQVKPISLTGQNSFFFIKANYRYICGPFKTKALANQKLEEIKKQTKFIRTSGLYVYHILYNNRKQALLVSKPCISSSSENLPENIDEIFNIVSESISSCEDIMYNIPMNIEFLCNEDDNLDWVYDNKKYYE